MDKMTNAYRLDFIFESTDEISDIDLVDMGIEVKEAITTFLRSKRYTKQLVGTVDISSGVIGR